MLEHARGLTADTMRAISTLEQRVLDADGGRLKLEWKTLRARAGERVEDLLWWDLEGLSGYVGLYRFGPEVELAGMVAPDARNRGIGGALLDAALAVCREQGEAAALLVVPRASEGGRALAERRGGLLDHSEHALRADRAPARPGAVADLVLRSAATADRPPLARMIEDGFGFPGDENDLSIDQPHGQTMMIERDGEVIGTIRTSRDGPSAGIYGFVIAADQRGRGFGRSALYEVCTRLFAGGAEHVGLEVEVDNDRALGLYTSLGFAPVTTEDYWRLATGP